MHGSETWPMKVEHELKLNHTEMSMIRWMCEVKVNERKKSEELGETLGLKPRSYVQHLNLGRNSGKSGHLLTLLRPRISTYWALFPDVNTSIWM